MKAAAILLVAVGLACSEAPDAAGPVQRDVEMVETNTTSQALYVDDLPQSDCPQYGVGASDDLTIFEGQAVNLLNKIRRQQGFKCAKPSRQLTNAANNHAWYLGHHRFAPTTNPCSDTRAHFEIEPNQYFSCSYYTGVTPEERTDYTGFTAGPSYGTPGLELVATRTGVTRTVSDWLDSVYHRLPFLQYATRRAGWGKAEGPVQAHAVMQFGKMPIDSLNDPAEWKVGVWPPPGGQKVPRQWAGNREQPSPKAPSTGWPSGYPISIYDDRLDKNGDCHPTYWYSKIVEAANPNVYLPHVFLNVHTDTNRFLTGHEVFMYTNTPMKANTVYRVRLQAPDEQCSIIIHEWEFVTGAI